MPPIPAWSCRTRFSPAMQPTSSRWLAGRLDRLDVNVDGLPDLWQETYFGSADDPHARPIVDDDGDGFTNQEEWIAGTDPGNGLFYPEIRWQEGTELLIPTSSNRIHRLESSPTLASPVWTVRTNIVGNGATVLMQVPRRWRYAMPARCRAVNP